VRIFFLALLLIGCTNQSDTKSYILRLKPGQEVKTELVRFAKENKIEAGAVVSAVGSLTEVALRYANKDATTKLKGHFEVVSLSGYLGQNDFHLHMAVSDGNGKTTGGHVMDGNVVYTTLVLVVQDYQKYRYNREFDPKSGYNELVITPK
jgi:predicted DNA-binding protein with PD1-like motif